MISGSDNWNHEFSYERDKNIMVGIGMVTKWEHCIAAEINNPSYFDIAA